MPVDVTCGICGVVFTAPARKKNRQKHCSWKCAGEARRGPSPHMNPPKFDYPPHDEIVALVKSEGSISGAAVAMGAHPRALGSYIKRRADLQERVQAASTVTVTYPPDDEIVRLVELHGGIGAAARAAGLRPSGLRKAINKRSALADKIAAMVEPWPSYEFPDDEVLFRLVCRHGNIKAAAEVVGVSRGSLQHHLSQRPDLRERLRAVSDYSDTANRYELPPDHELIRKMARLRTVSGLARDIEMPLQTLNYHLAQRPTLRKQLRALSIFNASPEEKAERIRAARRKRSKRAALTEDDVSYRRFVLNDPCVYCGATATTIDHVEPIADGGAAGASNMAPACKSCNSRKSSRSLLTFLLVR